MTLAPSPNRCAVLLAVLLVLGLGLRLVGIGGQGLWLDEAYTVTVAVQTPAEIVAETARDNHPPLYYLLLHGWFALTGAGVTPARLLAVLCGVLTVALGAALASRLAGTRAALVTAGLLAVCPFLVYYSQEIRQYSLLGLLCLGASYSLWRMAEGGRHVGGWAVAFAACSALSLYTMYVGGLVLVGNAVWGWRLCGKGGRQSTPADGTTRWHLVGALGAALLAFAPWVPTLWAQVHRLAAIIEPQNSLLKLPATLLVWVGGYTQTRHSFYSRDTQALVFLAVDGLVALGLLAALVGLGRTRGPERSALGLLWPALLPAAVLWAVSLRKPMYLTYTLLPGAVLFLVAAGVALAWLKTSGRGGVLALGGVLAVLSLGAYWKDPAVGRGDTFRRLAQWVQPRLGPEKTFICGNEGPYLAVAGYAALAGERLPGQAFLVTPAKIAPVSRRWPPTWEARAPLPRGRVVMARNEAEPWPETLRRQLPPPLEETLLPGSHQCPAMRAAVYELP